MSQIQLEGLVEEFLKKERIAIWGAASPEEWIARKIRRFGAVVVAVNPDFADDLVHGRASSLTKLNPPAQAVLVYAGRPLAMAAVDDCLAARVPLVWLHDALSPGAATSEAIEKLRSAGCTVIPGLCPMLFIKPIDPAHFCLKWVLRMTGKEGRVRQAVR